MTDNADFLKAVPPYPQEEDDADLTVPLWTDQYNNLFEILQ